jgi:hypothetical protein
MHAPHPTVPAMFTPRFDTLPPLSDEAAAQMLALLYQLVAEFESHFYAQLSRYYHDPPPDHQLDLFPDTEPPF